MNKKTIHTQKTTTIISQSHVTWQKKIKTFLAISTLLLVAPVIAHFVSGHHKTNDKKSKEGTEQVAEKPTMSIGESLVHGMTSPQEFGAILLIVFIFSINEVRKGQMTLNGEIEMSLPVSKNYMDPNEDKLGIHLDTLRDLTLQENGFYKLREYMGTLSDDDQQFAVNRMISFFIKERGTSSPEDLRKAYKRLETMSRGKIGNLIEADDKRAEWSRALNLLANVGLVLGLSKIMYVVETKSGSMSDAAMLAFLKLIAAMPLEWLSSRVSGIAFKIEKREVTINRTLEFLDEMIRANEENFLVNPERSPMSEIEPKLPASKKPKNNGNHSKA